MIKMANNELKEVLEKKFKLSTYLNRRLYNQKKNFD